MERGTSHATTQRSHHRRPQVFACAIDEQAAGCKGSLGGCSRARGPHGMAGRAVCSVQQLLQKSSYRFVRLGTCRSACIVQMRCRPAPTTSSCGFNADDEARGGCASSDSASQVTALARTKSGRDTMTPYVPSPRDASSRSEWRTAWRSVMIFEGRRGRICSRGRPRTEDDDGSLNNVVGLLPTGASRYKRKNVS